MSKFFRLCKANNKKHGLRDQSMDLEPNSSTSSRRGWKSGNFYFGLSILLTCLIFLTVGFYVFQITSSVTNGFKISDQEKKLNQLKLVNEKLMEEINGSEDLSYVKDKASELGLVSVEKVEYLDTLSGGVVVKK